MALQREMRSIVKSRFENTETKQGREHGDMLVCEDLNWTLPKPP